MTRKIFSFSLSFLLCITMIFPALLFWGCGEAVEEEAAPLEEKAHTEAPFNLMAQQGTPDEEEASASVVSSENALEFIPLRRLPYEDLRIPVMDSLELYGRLYDPSQKPESESEDDEDEAADEELEDLDPVEKYPLIILLHSLNGSLRDWDQLPARLVHEGYAVLVVDQRGHGKSVLNGRSWRSFKNEDWQRFPDDVTRMMVFFERSEDYPQVDASRVGIMGASLGANVALISGARDNSTENRIQALVILSAGMEYKGLESTKAIYRYKNPLMMIASQNDKYAFESTQMLNRLHTGIKTVKLYKNIGHGTDMIRFFPELQQEIVQWLVTSLPPTPAPIIYPADEDDEEEDEEE